MKLRKYHILFLFVFLSVLAFLTRIYFFNGSIQNTQELHAPEHINPDIIEHPELLDKEEEVKIEIKDTPTSHTMALGFSSMKEEYTNQKLTVKGKIPTWLNGMLLRSGPALFESSKNKASQWFDGCAMLHKFTLENGNITYSNKFVRSNYYDQVKNTGKFGLQKEKQSSLFGRLGALMSGNTPKYDNTNTQVCMIGGHFCAMTETPHHTTFDPITLESRQGFDFDDKLDTHYACAHPHLDKETGDMFNYAIQFGNTSTYYIYRIPAGTKERVPFAKINVGYPSYMHSFAMTENYVILTEVPFRINPLDLLMTDKSFIEAFKWNPKQGTKYTVIDQHTGKTVGTFTGSALFTLHHINAYEDDDTIVIDLAAYENPDVLYSFDLDDLRSKEDFKRPRAYATRVTIDLTQKPKEAVTVKKLSKDALEMPHINYENYSAQPYTYVYGTHARKDDKIATALIKINVQDGSKLVWHEDNLFPGEPIFVANPDGQDEDDGVLLATVLDTKRGISFLVILDARTMKELGRAELDRHIPFDSHGNFFPKK